MSREIEFRAWNNIAEQYKTGTELAETIVRTELDNCIELKGALYNISEVTLEQYTGLKDRRNGVKIFEGDIVKWDGYIGKIEWFSDSACFMQQMINSTGSHLIHDEVEVIGNIHENPELLK